MFHYPCLSLSTVSCARIAVISEHVPRLGVSLRRKCAGNQDHSKGKDWFMLHGAACYNAVIIIS